MKKPSAKLDAVKKKPSRAVVDELLHPSKRIVIPQTVDPTYQGPLFGYRLGTPFTGLDGPGWAADQRPWKVDHANIVEKDPLPLNCNRRKF